MASAACRVDVVLLNMNRKLILFLLRVIIYFLFLLVDLSVFSVQKEYLLLLYVLRDQGSKTMTGLYQQPTQMNSGIVIHLSFHSFNTFIQVDLHSSGLFGIFF